MKKKGINQESWYQRFARLNQYQIKHNRVAPRKDKDIKLLRWYYSYRARFEKGKLDFERSALWQQLPLQKQSFYRPNTFEVWKESWTELKEFQEANGQAAPLKSENFRQNRWYIINKSRYISGILKGERLTLWEQLPFR